MQKVVLITGVSGGIGKGLAKAFSNNGYFVTGLDVKDTAPDYCNQYYQVDLDRFCSDNDYYKQTCEKLSLEIPGLDVLINNAAVQILGSIDEITITDWSKTQNVNLTAPLLLSQLFLAKLEAAKGSIINIASIHQQLTKRRFVAYATSKSGLVGLTKAMSVDLQGRVRVNAISPAAIDTDMLREGFNNDEEKVQELNKLHPLQRIGTPEEVAALALMLAEDKTGFINGANICIDGGISNVLKDLE